MPRNLYFSHGVLDDGRDDKRFIVSWYEAFLETMDEEALYPAIQKRPPTYRLLRLPTFSHASAVRVFRGNHGWEMVGKITDGLGGYFPGKLVWELKRTLRLSESEQLEQLIHRLQFWTMLVND